MPNNHQRPLLPVESSPVENALSAEPTHDYQRPLSDTPQAEVTAQFDTSRPQWIGRYKILRVLGTGGFATVYLAHDPRLDRDVALKVARSSDVWSDEDAAKFVKEARTTAKLKHPHVVTVYDTDYCDEHGVYIAMEYVDGETLSHRLRKEPLPVETAVELVSQVAEAIHYGHRQGVIHRDLKPSNVLLENETSVKVSDFGLALYEDLQIKHEGEVSGTPSYMSPEQVRGESHRMDGRSDIWSLGVLLYESLTGKRPFSGSERKQIYDQILHREPKPLRQFDDRIPESIEELCLQCLSRNPSQRPSTALDVSRRLREALASPATVPGGRKFSMLACLLAAAVVVALGVALTVGGSQPTLGRGSVSEPEVDPSVRGGERTPPVREWHNLLEQPPRALIWNGGYVVDNYAHSRELNRFTVRTTTWGIFEFGNNEGRDFELRTSQIPDPQTGLCGVFWGWHRDETAFPKRKNVFRGVVLREMEPNELLLRLQEFTTAIGAGGVPYVQHTSTLRSERFLFDPAQDWSLQVKVVNGNVNQLVFQDQQIDLAEWPRDGARFDAGKLGVLAGNCYLVIPDFSVNYLE